MPRAYPQGTLFDGVTSFSGGVNSGLSPLLLEPNQLAFATNCTVRGGFVSHRPPYQKLTLDFGGDEDLQAAVEGGLFQGSMVYRPDFGNHLVISSISGRLFKFTVSGTTATIDEITPDNDPNIPTAKQVWMWQSEKYAIINDGINLPVIFDGTVSRRSFGGSRVLATTSADFTPPDVGQTVLLTLSQVYDGPFDVPVIINGAFYQPIKNPSASPTYDITLINMTANPGDTVPEGSKIYVDPSRIGAVVSIVSSTQCLPGFFPCPRSIFAFSPFGSVMTRFVLELTSVVGLSLGDTVNISGFVPAPINLGWPSVPVTYPARHPLGIDYTAQVVSVNDFLTVTAIDATNNRVAVDNLIFIAVPSFRV